MTTAPLSIDDRLGELLKHLGLRRAHVAGGFAPNPIALARSSPDLVASMTLVCPMQLPLEPFMPSGAPLLVFFGGRGPTGLLTRETVEAFADTSAVALRDYAGEPWSDAVAERRGEVLAAMLAFLSAAEMRNSVDSPNGLSGGDMAGEIAEVTYRVRGSGPPLLLLPLSLARSQWNPILPALAERFTTIVLGGEYLGVVPVLEGRMQGGYRNVVRLVVDAAKPRPGERVLEVGCGPGAVARWLATHLPVDNPITAVDINAYLLGEAAALSNAAGLSDRITLQECDAESLTIDSDSFDVTLSFTVMEEVDADRMLAELVRVTRPGGRIGVIVRATDLPRFLNIELPDELKVPFLLRSVPNVGVGDRGCGDASLYRRFVEAGLTDLQMGPQLAPDHAQRAVERMTMFTTRMAKTLPPAEARAFNTAIQRASDDGTLIFAEPYHCAVGTRS